MQNFSYIGYLTACKGHRLNAPHFGEMKHIRSSRFARSEQASKWVQEILEANCAEGRLIAATGWTMALEPPQIDENGEVIGMTEKRPILYKLTLTDPDGTAVEGWDLTVDMDGLLSELPDETDVSDAIRSDMEARHDERGT